MILAASIALIVIVLVLLLFIRQNDLPYVEPVSATAHLDERKTAIYENIRDANFEYLMGKLSEDDYKQTKADLQDELSEVNAEIASATGAKPLPVKPAVSGLASSSSTPAPITPQVTASKMVVCPTCGARYTTAMKFCGECGQSLKDGAA